MAGARPAADDVPPRPGHERSLPAPHHHRPRRQGDGRAARGRLRHHRRQRGDGDPVPIARLRRPEGAARPDPGRLRARRQAGLRARPRRRGRHGRAAARRAAAEPRADDRGRAPRSCTAVRSATSPTAATASSRRASRCGAPRSCSPRRASASTSAPRSSSTSSAARPGIWPTRWCSSRRCARSRCTAACPRPRRRKENAEALARGMENLEKHLESVAPFGLEPVVAINVRAEDTAEELQYVLDRLKQDGVEAGSPTSSRRAARAPLELAEKIVARALGGEPEAALQCTSSPIRRPRRSARSRAPSTAPARSTSRSRPVAARPRGARSASASCRSAWRRPTSRSPTTRSALGRPRDFEMTVREVRISAGAGFLVPLTGEILTMPGLPKRPHANDIDLTPDGTIVGVGAPPGRAARRLLLPAGQLRPRRRPAQTARPAARSRVSSVCWRATHSASRPSPSPRIPNAHDRQRRRQRQAVDRRRRRVERSLAGITAPVLSLAFARDGSLLAAGSEDATIRLSRPAMVSWSQPDRRDVRHHRDRFHRGWSPFLASSNDHTVRFGTSPPAAS